MSVALAEKGRVAGLSIVASLSWALTFCSPGSDRAEAAVESRGPVRHPVEAYSPYRDVPATSLVLNQTIESSVGWEQLFKVEPDPVAQIGGDSSALFTDITHLVAFQDGFVIGDNAEWRIHAFGPNGRAIGAVGRKGEGPAEFRRITAVSQVGKSGLAVADVMRRVELFESTDTLRYSRRVQLSFSATSICTIGERIFAYASPGADTLPPIRVLDAEWQEQGRIGQAYRSPSPMINVALGEVKLVCAPALDRLVLIPRAGLGDAYVLEADGTPVARFLWSDYQNLAIIEDGDGFSATIEPGGLNRLRSANLIQDSLILLQYDFVSEADFEADQEFTSLHSVIINLATGEVAGRSSNWPPLLILAGGGAVEHVNDVWPTVRVYRGVIR